MYILYMNVQAVLFGMNDSNTNDCRKWLNNHGYIPLKRVHNTSFFRYRILQPNYKKYISYKNYSKIPINKNYTTV